MTSSKKWAEPNCLRMSSKSGRSLIVSACRAKVGGAYSHFLVDHAVWTHSSYFLTTVRSVVCYRSPFFSIMATALNFEKSINLPRDYKIAKRKFVKAKSEEPLDKLRELEEHEAALNLKTQVYSREYNFRKRLMDWKMAIPIGSITGANGLLGAFELARKLNDNISSNPDLEYSPSNEEMLELINNISGKINYDGNVISLLENLQKYYYENYGNLRIIFYCPESAVHSKSHVLYRGAHIPKCQNLCVYKNLNGFYYVIKDVKRFFYASSAKKFVYCHDCNSLYKSDFPIAHKKSCPNLCKGCFLMHSNCEGNLDLQCDHCKRKFANQECFDYHLQNGLCGTPGKMENGKHWHCDKCDQDVLYDDFRIRNPIHFCYEKVCFKCYCYHPPLFPCMPSRKRQATNLL